MNRPVQSREPVIWAVRPDSEVRDPEVRAQSSTSTRSGFADGHFRAIGGLLATIMLVLLGAPVVALIWRSIVMMGQASNVGGAAGATSANSIQTALSISLFTTAISVSVILLFGTPLAWLFARYQFPFKRVLALLIELPIVMPPVVAGLALLSAFGRRGLFGPMLAELGIGIPFTWVAVVLAQVFVSAPFYIRAAQARFSILPRELEDAAGIDGADGWRVFWHITLPLSSTALISGLLLSWARALGEFGATILFAGNLQGRTQTMPLLVYGALERDLRSTFVVALILLGMAVMALGATRFLARLDSAERDPLAEG